MCELYLLFFIEAMVLGTWTTIIGNNNKAVSSSEIMDKGN
jgi:hypothetical protein